MDGAAKSSPFGRSDPLKEAQPGVCVDTVPYFAIYAHIELYITKYTNTRQ